MEESIMAKTRTGSMAIGFRAMGDQWRQDLDQVIAFAAEQGFEGIDIHAAPPATIRAALDSVLRCPTMLARRGVGFPSG